MNKRPRDVVAHNLKALLATHPTVRRLPDITAATGVSNGTLDRVRCAAAAVNVDDLERIGSAFGLSAWQMLVPDLDPAAPPQLATVSRERHVVQLLRAAEELRRYSGDQDKP